MVNVPAANLFPGTGPAGNGMTQVMTDQALWLRYMKTDGCISCHQLGDKATRTIPQQLGHFDTGAAAWERRIQSGQASGNMVKRHRPFRHPARAVSVRRLDGPRCQG